MQNVENIQSKEIHVKHVSYLDSIRGLAALTVLNEHFVIAYGLPCQSNMSCEFWLDFSPLHIWWDGMAAVSMFFVLSGLVLSLKYCHSETSEPPKAIDLKNFVIIRLCRIWPPYLFALLLCAALYPWIVASPAVSSELLASDWITQMWRGHTVTIQGLVQEAMLLRLPEDPILIPQAWTLKIELLLSLLLPLGILLLRVSLLWLLFFSVFAVYFLGASVFLIHFLCGLLLAHHLKKVQNFLSTTKLTRILLFILGLLLYTSADSLYPYLENDGLWFCSAAGSAMILACVLSSNTAQHCLSLTWLHHLGKISFSLYLLHMAVLICITPWLVQIIETGIHSQLLTWLFAYLTTALLSWVLASLSYHWVERPSMMLGKNMSQFQFNSVNSFKNSNTL